jgi:septum site-determining protein MinD
MSHNTSSIAHDDHTDLPSETSISISHYTAGSPVIVSGNDDASEAYKDLVRRFLGESDLPMRFVTAEQKGFFGRIMDAARG